MTSRTTLEILLACAFTGLSIGLTGSLSPRSRCPRCICPHADITFSFIIGASDHGFYRHGASETRQKTVARHTVDHDEKQKIQLVEIPE